MSVDDVFPIHYPNINKTVLFYNDFQKDSFSILHTDGAGRISYLKTLDMFPEGMNFRPRHGKVLDDGDILLMGSQLFWGYDSTRHKNKIFSHARITMRFDNSLLDPLMATTPATVELEDYLILSNPVKTKTRLKFNNSFSGSIHILDGKGTIYKSIPVRHQEQIDIDMGAFNPGMYYLAPLSTDAAVRPLPVKKIIKL